MKFVIVFIIIFCLSLSLYLYDKIPNSYHFQFMAQVKQAKQQVKQQTQKQIKQQTKQQVKQQTKQQVKQQTKQQVKQQTKQQVKQQTKQQAKQQTKQQTKQVKKLGNTMKKGCPSGQVKVGDSCVKGYQAKDGKCKKGDGLYQGNCFKQATNLSQYGRLKIINPTIGQTDSIYVNSKPTPVVYIGNDTYSYVQGNQIMLYNPSTGTSIPLSSSNRRSIFESIGNSISSALNVLNSLYGQTSDPNVRAQAESVIIAPMKGIGFMTNNDVTNLGIKPGQSYNYQGKQYTVYQNGDKYTVGMMPCKGVCTDNVKGQQAAALSTTATQWATIGNAPVPGVTKYDMTPGKVYSYGGKNYQVNPDGQSFSQCTSVGGAGGQELRGMFSSCIGRPSPASASLEQAINIANSRLTNLSMMQTIARDYLTSHPNAPYSQYAAVAPAINRLTESEYNNILNHMNDGPQIVSQINQRPSIPGMDNYEHQPVIYSATSDFISRNHGATYDEYKQKYGAGSLTHEEYNAMREKYGLPPI